MANEPSCKPVRKPPLSPHRPGVPCTEETGAVGSPDAAPARSPTSITSSTEPKAGNNDLRNLLEQCWHHHRLVHEGGWNVRLDDRGDILAIRPNGNVLRAPPPAPNTDAQHIADTNTKHGITIDPTTCIPRCYGDKLDLDHIITGLLCIDHPELVLGTTAN
jgi:hypothetical protein